MRKGSGGFYFASTLLLGIAFCFLCALAAYYTLFRFTPEDEREYRRLMLVSNPALAGNSEQSPYTARQRRQGVQKDFSYLRGGVPLRVRLLSSEAELVLDRQDDSTQIIEEMHGVKTYMQEELFYVLPDGREVIISAAGGLLLRSAPAETADSRVSREEPGLQPMQVLRYLEADAGSYSYKSERCTARNVLVERYIVPGHDLVQDLKGGQLILKGVAESVEFTMSGEDPHFTAQRLKATVFMPGRM